MSVNPLEPTSIRQIQTQAPVMLTLVMIETSLLDGQLQTGKKNTSDILSHPRLMCVSSHTPFSKVTGNS